MRRIPAILLVIGCATMCGCDERPEATGTRSAGAGFSSTTRQPVPPNVDAAGTAGQRDNPGAVGGDGSDVPLMPLDQFWAIMHAAKSQGGGTQAGMAAALEKALVRLSEPEMAAFFVRYDDLEDAAYRWDVWAAAYIMNGGCSDDSFIDFRNWLIAAGRRVYEAALLDPDSLAGVPDALTAEGVTFEELFGSVVDAYDRVSRGRELPRTKRMVTEPAGEDFDFDDEDEMRRRFPKLAAKYLDR